ncbi:LPS-assembly protein LptD [Ideonella alba]|uniref:LPS-assembly protein LptD n=1 Tax=Ideonella alba TaxID=2824118 RepID=A0A940YG36_9BURK|nr:LPS assembly protein LptD [Ideonella alba]MBQ0932666.1 LPS-assembly protein LptD [Ideonella alba]
MLRPRPSTAAHRLSSARLPRLVPVAAAVALGLSAAPVAAMKIDTTDDRITLEADQIRSQLDDLSVARGNVDLRQGDLRLTTDLLEFSTRQRRAWARAPVRVEQAGNLLEGRSANVQLDTREGQIDGARYRIARTGGGGTARVLNFTGTDRLAAEQASYTSCRADDPDTADWVLQADRLSLDFEHNDGRAEGASLRFLGVPILALPVLSFPATGERKSGWLPPTIYPFDSRNGFELETPYYVNLAPDHDLTLTPGVLTRRGLSLTGEYRYLWAQDEGRLKAHWLPNDRTTGRSRGGADIDLQGERASGLHYQLDLQHASDDSYWKDFSRVLPSLTPRLLAQDLRASQPLSAWLGLPLQAYARVLGWRTLQVADAPILPPYQRLPQLGLMGQGEALAGLNWSTQLEFNHFTLRNRATGDTRPDGERAHLLGALWWPHDLSWGWFTPRMAINAASYRTDQAMSDGRTRASRAIPTLSLDTGLRFERSTELFGRTLSQTLEPRLHYVRTPWRNQDTLPNFDSSVNDFNEISIYQDNGFSGVDFVTDVHQVTLGAGSRWFDPVGGGELLRLGLAQRYLFKDQRITPERLGASGLGAESGVAASRFSDVLLFGSSTVVPQWRFDVNLQYNTDRQRTTRSILAARWQPGDFKTLSATYRFARELSEQVELGWQWPIYQRETPRAGGSACGGTLYGVGRINFSRRDARVTEGLAGLEYDAGCWIGRVVAERVSTGTSEATTRLMVQLELIGLSRLGPSPLKVLKDNIPGYRMLRDDGAASTTSP